MDGILKIVDDVFIFAKTEEEFESRMINIFKRYEEFGMTLNGKISTACWLNFEANGVSADLEKLHSLMNFPQSENITHLRLTRLVNYLGAFS